MRAAAFLAMYKGPASGLRNKIGHWTVCIATASKYSHVELVIDGVCYSSSFRDGGVRAKVIADLETSGHFDLFPIEVDKAFALRRFHAELGKPYDWIGMLRTLGVFRWLPRREGARFCSELVGVMLGAYDPETLDPEDIMQRYTDVLA